MGFVPEIETENALRSLDRPHPREFLVKSALDVTVFHRAGRAMPR
jgi:hypothetical protein